MDNSRLYWGTGGPSNKILLGARKNFGHPCRCTEWQTERSERREEENVKKKKQTHIQNVTRVSSYTNTFITALKLMLFAKAPA